MEIEFNVEFAKKYSVKESIIFSTFQELINKNKEENINFFEGRYWIYCSHIEFTNIFPYWTKGQIEGILNNMINKGVLIKGNFSENHFDRTNWYTISDKSLN
jgi:hypothetical protein